MSKNDSTDITPELERETPELQEEHIIHLALTLEEFNLLENLLNTHYEKTKDVDELEIITDIKMQFADSLSDLQTELRGKELAAFQSMLAQQVTCNFLQTAQKITRAQAEAEIARRKIVMVHEPYTICAECGRQANHLYITDLETEVSSEQRVTPLVVIGVCETHGTEIAENQKGQTTENIKHLLDIVKNVLRENTYPQTVKA